LTLVYTVVAPESLYESLVKVTVKFLSHEPITFSRVIVPAQYTVIDFSASGHVSGIPSEFSYTESLSAICLKPSRGECEIKLELLLQGAVESSYGDLFPLISTYLQLEFSIEPLKKDDKLIVHIRFPSRCHGYIHYSEIEVDDTCYRFLQEENELLHTFAGTENPQVSYVAVHSKKNEPSLVKTKIRAHYRRSFISLSALYLLPLLVGLPIIVVWGYPNLDLVTRMSFTLTAVPIVFSLWYKMSSGMLSPRNLLNFVYLVSAVIWSVYAFVFQGLGIQMSGWTFLPYSMWIGYHFWLLWRFGRHPLQVKVDASLRFFRWVFQSFVKATDRISYRRLKAKRHTAV